MDTYRYFYCYINKLGNQSISILQKIISLIAFNINYLIKFSCFIKIDLSIISLSCMKNYINLSQISVVCSIDQRIDMRLKLRLMALLICLSSNPMQGLGINFPIVISDKDFQEKPIATMLFITTLVSASYFT